MVGSYQNLTALSFGSILGTVIFLICLALGCAAAIYPIEHPDFPLKYIFNLWGDHRPGVWFFHGRSDQPRRGGDRPGGLFPLFGLPDPRPGAHPGAKSEIEEAEGEVSEIVKEPVWHFPLMLGGGLVGLVIGALLVIKGVRLCLGVCGLAETLLGVTLLAIAANSVELVEAIIPAQKGHSEVMIGYVAGSCVFQLLFTLGIAALIRPLEVEPVALYFVFPAVALAWLLLVAVVWHGKTPRWAGAGLVALYLFFVAGTVIFGFKI